MYESQDIVIAVEERRVYSYITGLRPQSFGVSEGSDLPRD